MKEAWRTTGKGNADWVVCNRGGGGLCRMQDHFRICICATAATTSIVCGDGEAKHILLCLCDVIFSRVPSSLSLSLVFLAVEIACEQSYVRGLLSLLHLPTLTSGRRTD